MPCSHCLFHPVVPWEGMDGWAKESHRLCLVLTVPLYHGKEWMNGPRSPIGYALFSLSIPSRGKEWTDGDNPKESHSSHCLSHPVLPWEGMDGRG